MITLDQTIPAYAFDNVFCLTYYEKYLTNKSNNEALFFITSKLSNHLYININKYFQATAAFCRNLSAKYTS